MKTLRQVLTELDGAALISLTTGAMTDAEKELNELEDGFLDRAASVLDPVIYGAQDNQLYFVPSLAEEVED